MGIAVIHVSIFVSYARIRRGTGGPEPLENHKAIAFIDNTGPDPLENHKAIPSQHSLGPPGIQMAFL